MQLSVLTPRKFLSPLLSQKSIVSSDFDTFKLAIVKYVQDVQAQNASKQSEPNIVAGALMPFLQANPFAYNCRPHSQKGQSGIDLAILTGNDVKVIVEAKAVGSKDMITGHDLNRKAFHEAIFYFMQERQKGNDKLTHIVITDFYQWFVFDSMDFDRLFWHNDQLKKTFLAYHNPSLLKKNTAEVYAAIQAQLPKMLKDLFTEVAIECAYFNVASPQTIKTKELTAIYKLVSPDCLLKAFNPNDANSLNREFYNELLYILGLKEIKENNKRLIKAEGGAGSLYFSIADKLDQQNKPHGFEDVIKLIIIWINRVLFLKLLESQIVTWTEDQTKRFLNTEKIPGYDALENLFFDTLARPVAERTNKSFAYIPYLNSSLFEMQHEEKAGIGISALSASSQITYYNKTVVRVHGTKDRKIGQTNTLGYLFEFLDAYNFANDSGDEVVAETKNLISASVLGLIFEKINGYKDGSYFTPSFVTMYMARQNIEKAILQKFNEKYGWTCTALLGDGGLKNEIKDQKIKKQDSNAIIDSLKICDPAVGSGHFLVSSLNEILYIKCILGVLIDEGGTLLDYSISIENDELIVTSDKGELFEYKKSSKEKTLVQKTLFQEKQKIIENCLFGVDINPNSVNICRLRLWIELLKNAYYKPDGTLETLPNIDINIKCGNSLISRFGLDTDLKDALKKSKISVNDYRTAVSNYRNTSDKAKKRELESLITDIKGKFRKELQTNDPNINKLKKAEGTLKTILSQDALFEEDDKVKKEKQKVIANLYNSISKYEAVIENIKSDKIYQNAFEWRLEFPEVLNESGAYVGFDVLIGNPPYIFARENFTAQEKSYFTANYELSAYQINSYILFLEKCTNILRAEGRLTLILPNNWLTINSAKAVRQFVLANSEMNIINFADKVFDVANVDTAIVSFTKSNDRPTVELYEASNIGGFQLVKKVSANLFLNKKNAIINIAAFRDSNIHLLLEKIEATSPVLKQIADVKAGVQAYEIGKGSPVQTETMRDNRIYHSAVAEDKSYFSYLDGKDVSRYMLSWSGEFLRYGINLAAPRKWSLFATPRILVRQIPAQPPYCIHACFTDKVMLNDRNSMNIVNIKEKPLFVLAVLNSRLLSFWFIHKFGKLQRGIFPQFKLNELEQFPIAKSTNQQLFVIKAEKILQAKENCEDSGVLEREIDHMVYKLYSLTYDEVKIIDPEYSTMGREEYDAYG